MNRSSMLRATRVASSAALLVAAWLVTAGVANAAIPDADIRDQVNQAGFGMISGVFARADFAISDRSAVGGYFGSDPNDVFFGDFDRGDDLFDSNALVGGHYMYQFLEGDSEQPNISGIAGAFANRHGMRPELGFALSYPFDDRWTGRANIVYGPSWGLEMGYKFKPNLEGTFGITGMGLLGLALRF